MKRGATHVDWAVSMGMFVIYVMSMFIFMQPGAQKVFREDNLINIVENGLLKGNDKISATNFVLEKTPMIITFTEKGKQKLGSPVDLILDGTSLPFEATNEDDKFYRIFFDDKEEAGLSIRIDGTKADTFRINYGGAKEDTVKYVMYYLPGTGFTVGEKYVPSANQLNIETDFNVEYGTTEKLEGLNVVNFDPNTGICKDGYEQLKQNLGFPITKEFRVYYVGPAATVSPTYNDGALQPQYICNDFPEPYEQANVYVKEIVTTSMDELGNKQQVRVNIQVW
ncbi:hypothetical protein D6777_02005 [Candidatus Woesearchaeota archaeon]|nr:MAG: hypothetical protein D6777_02005 [Candidatus Woesearchaeota archaeon]